MLVGALMLLPLSGCSGCLDEFDSGWEIDEDHQFEWPEDAGVDAQDAADVAPDAPEDTWEIVDAPDAADEPVDPPDPWQTEQVEPAVPQSHALTDRTSLAVDPDGTLWLGYHWCGDLDCASPNLRVTHKPVGGQWTGETIIEPHEGIFGVDVITADEPIVAFPDNFEDDFKVGMRSSDGSWQLSDLDVRRRSDYDGFDVTNDGSKYFVTFAADNAPSVELFTYDVTAPAPQWLRQAPLRVPDPQAAMERGFRADLGDSAYLVHQNGDTGAYGIARYDEELDAWPQKVYYEDYANVFVHSFYITTDFRLCLSSDYQSNLLVTCGSMFDLTLDEKLFSNQVLARGHPSSIIEGDDGTLYVAFNPEGNDELRVARRKPGEDWTVETVFDGPSYGVSTAIAHSGDLVISFYTCDDDQRCSLQVLWETPE